jgi:hypothetical protein
MNTGSVGPIAGETIDYPAPFTPETIEGIVGHMNGDHTDSCLAICQVFGGQPAATAARIFSVMPDGAHFLAEAPDGEVEVVVPWGTEIVERFDIRLELERLHREAYTALGIPLDEPEEH